MRRSRKSKRIKQIKNKNNQFVQTVRDSYDSYDSNDACLYPFADSPVFYYCVIPYLEFDFEALNVAICWQDINALPNTFRNHNNPWHKRLRMLMKVQMRIKTQMVKILQQVRVKLAEEKAKENSDFIIVGAGTAGSFLANAWSRTHLNNFGSVLCLEPGTQIDPDEVVEEE